MLYYTRYQDCGEGVVEVTWMMYNMGTPDDGLTSDTWSYLNVPWGGVRASTLRDVVIDTKGKSQVLTPLRAWGDAKGAVLKDLKTFDGYTAFAQALQRPAKPFVAPAGLKVSKAGACADSTSHSKRFGRLTLKMRLNPTAVVKTGSNEPVQIVNSAGKSMALTGVLHWAWGGRDFYFWPKNQDKVSALKQCNSFVNQQTLRLTAVPDRGMAKRDNLGLAFVHGSEGKGSFKGDSGWEKRRKACRVRMGSTNVARDFTVWTVNAFNKVPQGASYSYRQSIVTDSFMTLENRAKVWSNEAEQRFLSNHNINSPGRTVGLYSGAVAGSFGVGVAGKCGGKQPRCEGRTTPHAGARALFAVQCGDKNYVGFDRYHFKTAAAETGSYALPLGLEIKQRNCAVSDHHTASTKKLTLVMTMAATATVKSGTHEALKFVNSAGSEMDVNDVRHWSWAGKYLYFHPKEQNPAKALAQCKALGVAALAVKSNKVQLPAKRPYAQCGTDAKGLPVRPTWKLLGFFKKGVCSGMVNSALSVDMCDVAAPVTLSPTPTPAVKQKRKVLKANMAFSISIVEAQNPAVQEVLALGVARSLGKEPKDVKILSINGRLLSTRRLLSDDVQIEFQIMSDSNDVAAANQLKQDLQKAAADGAVVRNIQEVATQKGVLVNAIQEMSFVIPKPAVTIGETEVAISAGNNPLAGVPSTPVRTRNGQTVQLKEGADFTSTCSHVKCSLKASIVRVHHHDKEQYGHTHVCKNGMHTSGKCGCECFTEDVGMLTEFAGAGGVGSP